jgi:hypothetical protein
MTAKGKAATADEARWVGVIDARWSGRRCRGSAERLIPLAECLVR